MGYTQYWKHGTYRLDNGAFEDIEALLKVNLKDVKSIVGEEAVDEYVAALGRRYVWTLGDVLNFECLSRHYIRTNALGETAMFFDTVAAMCMWHYLIDSEVCDISYKEFCKPDHNMLADAALCAMLIAISMHNPNADISSDGNWNEDNWQAGAKLYELACGKKAKCPKNVALVLRTFNNDNSPAYVHVYRGKANIYAPYDKRLSGDYTSEMDAVATLIVHGYEEDEEGDRQ